MAKVIDRSAFPSHYYLHVREDGTEVAYDEEPEGILTSVVRLVEVTDQLHDDNGRGRMKIVRPRGEGWYPRFESHVRSWWERGLHGEREVHRIPNPGRRFE